MILEEISVIDAPSGDEMLAWAAGGALATIAIGLLFCS
jgi:hypothetical protein